MLGLADWRALEAGGDSRELVVGALGSMKWRCLWCF